MPLKPEDDELLSSWLARVALAHGVTVDELISSLLPKGKLYLWMTKDIDLGFGRADILVNTKRTALLDALSKRCAASSDTVNKTTLDEFDGRLYRRLYISRLYSWITPNDLRRERYIPGYVRRFGVQACPQCLAQDNTPYFRRRWRFGFVTTCPIHESLLIDRCPACGASIKFHESVSAPEAASGMMTVCYECGFDLKNVEAQRRADSDVVEFQEHLVGVARSGRVGTEENEDGGASRYLMTLYWLLKVATHWHPIAARLQNVIFARYGLERSKFDFPKEDGVESLDVERRYELVRLLCRLLIDPPVSYFQSSDLDDLMCRIWLSRWALNSSWTSPTVSAEEGVFSADGKQLHAERPNTSADPSKKRPFAAPGEYAQRVSDDELKRAALQLLSDGIATIHIGHILRVSHGRACELTREMRLSGRKSWPKSSTARR